MHDLDEEKKKIISDLFMQIIKKQNDTRIDKV